MTVVLSRPYEFIPPHRGDRWPSFIQAFRLIDWHLRRKEGVVEHECRNLDAFREVLDRRESVLLTPNHCRYADPIVLGWPARVVKTHLYAMASWHLFNTTSFESFALRRMGAFSINREGNDKQAVDKAIEYLVEGKRPLVVFPEGTTNRTNDLLKPLLDGVAFIARRAAKKRQKQDGGNVVALPVALKYLCLDDIESWADHQLGRLESQLGWHQAGRRDIIGRTMRLVEGMLALKEIEYTGTSASGPLPERRDRLMHFLLDDAEQKMEMTSPSASDVRERVRKIRSRVVGYYFSLSETEMQSQRPSLLQIAEEADFAQNLLSFPDCYLWPGEITDTRILETIQRIQESIYGKADQTMRLKVIVEFADAIEVSDQRPPRGEADPLLESIRTSLSGMLDRLSGEARLIG
ncbi:lysophospholipid acyltransferase family protein [Crateriforma conspicua]|uniref:Glycerol-3-phosphate acyltransferase n=1 Tax=Crateriforma conspicua TaxID=2527996 RepID=A0A5C6FUS4_9PLAN|nr:lysophospholipid acyltransferase family protein [Crateriforma conspicua]TWU65260.1 glycerol-3-phosphate acyltransferase [Crateriforma conspicua]